MERIGDLERRYVLEVLDSQFRSSEGSRMTMRLEQKFAEVFRSTYAIAFVNGTATMHSALAAAGVGPGDEVIVPPLTMSSTSFAVLHTGAIPLFADIHPDMWTLDPQSVAERVGPRTRAIIPVSLYGLPPDMDGLMEIAQRHNLFVLEDDAQCFLGYYKGRIMGSIGHASSFSFQASKHMTSGEGGMVTTNDPKLAENIRRFNSLGYAGVGAKKGKITKDDIQDPNYQRHVSVGFNYRLPELCAAVALGQLERIEELVEARRKVARVFAQAVQGCRWLAPQWVPPCCTHAYWTYVLRLNNGGAFSWHEFRDQFRKRGGDGIYAAWQLTHLEPAFRNVRFSERQRLTYEKGLCPVAEAVQPQLLQFKTNYWTFPDAERQAEVLYATITHFN